MRLAVILCAVWAIMQTIEDHKEERQELRERWRAWRWRRARRKELKREVKAWQQAALSWDPIDNAAERGWAVAHLLNAAYEREYIKRYKEQEEVTP